MASNKIVIDEVEFMERCRQAVESLKQVAEDIENVIRKMGYSEEDIQKMRTGEFFREKEREALREASLKN